MEAKFKYPLAITGSESQLMEIADKMKTLGYQFLGYAAKHWAHVHNRLTTPYTDAFNSMGFFCNDLNTKLPRTEVSTSNPELVLALAAMREGNDFHVGESIISVGDDTVCGGYTKGKLYTINEVIKDDFLAEHRIRSIDNLGSPNGWGAINFRKATKEEIIAHYSPKNSLNYTGTIQGADSLSPDYKIWCKGAANTITNNTMKKITHFKLIKRYPGSAAIGHLASHETFNSCYQDYPEFWEPVYEEVKPETKLYYLPDVGEVCFNRKEGTIYHKGVMFPKKSLIGVITPNKAAIGIDPLTDKLFEVKVVSVDIGCKKGVLVAEIEKMLKEFDEFMK